MAGQVGLQGASAVLRGIVDRDSGERKVIAAVAVLIAAVLLICCSIPLIFAGVSQASGNASALHGNQAIAAQFFIDKGLDTIHIAAILGNIEKESGFDTGIEECQSLIVGDRDPGFGLIQWTGARRVALESFADSQGLPPSDTNLQLQFLWAEMTGEGDARAYVVDVTWMSPGGYSPTPPNYRPSFEGFLRANSFEGGQVNSNATYYFARFFLRPNDTWAGWDTRDDHARRFHLLLTTGGLFSTGTGQFVGDMTWPVPGFYRVSSPFGYRVCPIRGGMAFHSGIDIARSVDPPMSIDGATIVAAMTGQVTHVGWMGGYGVTVDIYHGGGVLTRYAHMQLGSPIVSVGQAVAAGQPIGRVGSTGDSTGPHLHFEVRVNSSAVDPMQFR